MEKLEGFEHRNEQPHQHLRLQQNLHQLRCQVPEFRLSYLKIRIFRCDSHGPALANQGRPAKRLVVHVHELEVQFGVQHDGQLGNCGPAHRQTEQKGFSFFMDPEHLDKHSL